MSGRELVAYAIANTTAESIEKSVARVVPHVAKRLGYVLVGCCRHCTDAVIVVDRGSPWIHREHRTVSCLAKRTRSGLDKHGGEA